MSNRAPRLSKGEIALYFLTFGFLVYSLTSDPVRLWPVVAALVCLVILELVNHSYDT